MDTTGLKGNSTAEIMILDMKHGWAPVNIPENDSRNHSTQKSCLFLGMKPSTFEK